MSAAVSEKPKDFEETDTEETHLHYGLGTFNWPVRVLWAGLVVLLVWYVVQYYVPSLAAWIPWKP